MSAARNYLFYPGCSQEHAGIPYAVSARAVMQALGSPLKEIEDWNCCGATSYFSIHELQAFALSARNLALAEQQGATDVITVCNACYAVLAKTEHYLAEDAGLKKRVNDALETTGLHYYGKVATRHLADVIVSDLGLDAIKPKLVKKLDKFTVAPYYGCLFSRPGGHIDDPERPRKLDTMLAALGAKVIDCESKARCCGGMIMQTDEDVCLRLMESIIMEAYKKGSRIMVTACPLCHVNLELALPKIEAKLGQRLGMSVLFFTQLLGLALGLSWKEVGINQMLSLSDETKSLAASV